MNIVNKDFWVGVINYLKYYIAYVIYLVKFSNKKNNIWLVGERLAKSANDNGFAFFEYLLNEKGCQENAFFVFDDEELLRQNLSKFQKNTVRLNSIKHFILYFRCEYLFVSHGVRDACPTIIFFKLKSLIKPVIYLQHGVIKFKKIYYNREVYNKSILRFIASTRDEKEIISHQMMPRRLEHDLMFAKYNLHSHLLFKENGGSVVSNYISKYPIEVNLKEKLNFLNSRVGIEPSRVPICGLARFDKLRRDSLVLESDSSILIFPTWRDDLKNKSKEEFIESDYFTNYKELITNENLHKLLLDSGLKIKFHLHSEMLKFREQFSSFESESIIVSGEGDVRKLIITSKMLITDYSSVAWDFYLLGKKTLFFQFDSESYKKLRSDYCTKREDWFGDICLNSSDVISKLTNYIERNEFSTDKLTVPENCCSSIYREVKGIPKKVVFLVYNIYGIGGTVRTIINNANYLYSNGYNVEVISVKRTSDVTKLGLNPGIPIKVLFDGRNNGRKYKKVKRSIKVNVMNISVRLLSRFKSKLIDKHEDLYNSFTLFTDVQLIKELKKLNNCNLITTIPSFNIIAPKLVKSHVGVIGQEHKSFFAHNVALQEKIKSNYNNLSCLAVLTEDDYKNYKYIMRNASVSILPNATKVPKLVDFRNRTPKSVVTLARFVKEKRIDLLIEAFSKVVETDNECVLNIYGDGPLKSEMMALVKNMGLGNNIIINNSTTDIETVLLNNSIFALSSESEGFGMVIIEANAHGLPVVSFDIPNGPKTLIQHGVTGLKAKAFDTSDFSLCILKLINDIELRNRLANSAYEYVKTEYSLNAVGKQLENLLHNQ